MQCERARELLSPYLDGELSAQERRAVAAHIEGCRACAAQVADFQRIGRTLAEAGREPMPKALALRVRANLAREAEAEAADRLCAGSRRSSTPARRRALVRRARALLRQAAVIAAACVLSALATWWIVGAAGEAVAPGAGGARRPRPLAAAGQPDPGGLLRRPHRQAVVRRPHRFLARSEGPRGRGLPAARRAARLRRRPPRRRRRLQAPPAHHQRVHVAQREPRRRRAAASLRATATTCSPGAVAASPIGPSPISTPATSRQLQGLL